MVGSVEDHGQENALDMAINYISIRGSFTSREVVFILDFYFSLYITVSFQLFSFWISFFEVNFYFGEINCTVEN